MKIIKFLPLEEVMVNKRESVDPSKTPNEVFDLYSVPAYDSQKPERLLGSEIGSAKKVVQLGDVLLSRIVPHIRRAWVVGSSNGHRQIGSGEWMIFSNKNVWPDYLRHLLISDWFHPKLMQTVSGVGGSLLRARPTEVARIEIPIPHKNGKPDLDEQKRIAAILDKADAIRRKHQQALRLTDDFLRSLFLDMFGDPATNPKGFPVGVIADLLDSVNYGTSKKASIAEGQYPILRMGNITYEGGWDFSDLKYIDLEDKEKPKHLVHNGQLLFNRTNSKELVGKTAVYREDEPMAFAGYLVRGIANRDADAEYVSAYLNSRHGKQTLAQMCKNIVGMANINAKEMQTIRILLPPPDLQRSFGDIARSIHAKQDSWKSLEKESEALFSSLQQRAFRGEL